MRTSLRRTVDLVTFTEEILDGKLHCFEQFILKTPEFLDIYTDINKSLIKGRVSLIDGFFFVFFLRKETENKLYEFGEDYTESNFISNRIR